MPPTNSNGAWQATFQDADGGAAQSKKSRWQSGASGGADPVPKVQKTDVKVGSACVHVEESFKSTFQKLAGRALSEDECAQLLAHRDRLILSALKLKARALNAPVRGGGFSATGRGGRTAPSGSSLLTARRIQSASAQRFPADARLRPDGLAAGGGDGSSANAGALLRGAADLGAVSPMVRLANEGGGAAPPAGRFAQYDGARRRAASAGLVRSGAFGGRADEGKASLECVVGGFRANKQPQSGAHHVSHGGASNHGIRLVRSSCSRSLQDARPSSPVSVRCVAGRLDESAQGDSDAAAKCQSQRLASSERFPNAATRPPGEAPLTYTLAYALGMVKRASVPPAHESPAQSFDRWFAPSPPNDARSLQRARSASRSRPVSRDAAPAPVPSVQMYRAHAGASARLGGPQPLIAVETGSTCPARPMSAPYWRGLGMHGGDDPVVASSPLAAIPGAYTVLQSDVVPAYVAPGRRHTQPSGDDPTCGPALRGSAAGAAFSPLEGALAGHGAERASHVFAERPEDAYESRDLTRRPLAPAEQGDGFRAAEAVDTEHAACAVVEEQDRSIDADGSQGWDRGAVDGEETDVPEVRIPLCVVPPSVSAAHDPWRPGSLRAEPSWAGIGADAAGDVAAECDGSTEA